MDNKIKELKEKIAKLEEEIEQTEKSEKKSKEKKSKEKKEKLSEVNMGFIPTKTLLKWKSFSRVYIKREKPWFLKIAVIALLFILLAAFLQDFILILVICVIVLIVFLLASVPPDEVTHKITNKGIRSIGKLYKWEELKEFWIGLKNNQRVLHIDTKKRSAPKLVILVPRRLEKRVVKMLGKRLDYKDMGKKQGWLSKLADGEYIPPKKFYIHF